MGLQVSQKEGQVVYLDTEKCGVPGLQLLLDFVTPEEEQASLPMPGYWRKADMIVRAVKIQKD